MITLAEFLQTHTTPAIASTLTTLATASISISHLLDKGALAGIHGEAGNENVQGEAQKKLDVISNDLLLGALTRNPHCAGVASEELHDPRLPACHVTDDQVRADEHTDRRWAE